MPNNLDINTLETWLWDAACKIRGAIDASKLFSKGRPKNYLTDENIQKVYEVYSEWKNEEGISKVIKNEEAMKSAYNLSPSRYVSQNGGEEILPKEEAIVLLKEAVRKIKSSRVFWRKWDWYRRCECLIKFQLTGDEKDKVVAN